MIVPQLGAEHRRRGAKQWLYLPYEEICRIMEWQVGQFTYSPGMAEGFDSLAYSQAYNEGDCIENGDERWCWEDVDGDHHHPLCAITPFAGDFPPDLIDLSCLCEENGMLSDEWDAACELLESIRGRLWMNPAILLDQPLCGKKAALEVLRLAGYDIPASASQRQDLVQLVKDNLDSDESLAEAFADLGAVNYASVVDDSEVSFLGLKLDELIEWTGHADGRLVEPSEIQLLAFDPEDFIDYEHPGGRRDVAQLWGEWMCVDATYRSVLDLEERRTYPWILGWREAVMKRCSWTEVDNPELKAAHEQARARGRLAIVPEDWTFERSGEVGFVS